MPTWMVCSRSLVAALLLAVQLGAFAAWTPHAGSTDRGPSGVHVEAGGTSECPTPHDESRCAVCHWLTQWRIVSPAPILRPPTPRIIRAPIADLAPPPDLRATASVLPRAPPTLLA